MVIVISAHSRATLSGQLDVVKFMLSHSKYQPLHNLGTKETPLLVACRKGLHNIAKTLLEHSPKLVFASEAQNNLSSLHIACAKGDVKMVSLLLDAIKKCINSDDFKGEKEFVLDFRDRLGRTPLYNACYFGYFEVAKLLVDFYLREKGCFLALDVNAATTNEKRTPLLAAICSNSVEIVRLLLTFEEIHSIEGYPSQRTLENLLMNFQKTRKGCNTAKQPQIVTTESWADFLACEVGIVAKNSIVSERSRSSMPRKLVSSRGIVRECDRVKELKEGVDAFRLSSLPGLTVIEHSGTGELICQLKNSPSHGKEFNQILITPLAEAYACLNTEMIQMLLGTYPGSDPSGLACRIAYLLQRPDLIKLILYQNVYEDASCDPSPVDLELDWSEKNLMVCEGEWFNPWASLWTVQNPTMHGMCNNDSLNFRAIYAVRLESNQLSSVPLELFQLQTVRKINLADNKISQLPTALWNPEPKNDELPELTSECGSFASDSRSGWTCNCLEELDVSKNRLLCTPACLWALPKIQTVKCSRNNMRDLCSFLGEPDSELLQDSNLKSIDLSFNDLFHLPEFVVKLPHLCSLNLNDNRLSEFPEALWECEALEKLEVANNKLSSLLLHEPKQISRKSLDTNSLQVKCNTFQKYCSKLWSLNISNNQFSMFPEALACLAPGLAVLKMSHNKFSTVDIHFLPFTLKKLEASHCGITRLGNTISKAKYVEISQNCQGLGSFGQACQHRIHSRLPGIHDLDISHNELRHMQLLCHEAENESVDFGARESESDSVRNDSSLSLLYPLLQELNLRSNHLVEGFNPNISHQAYLRVIRFGGNSLLHKIPAELSYLKKYGRFTELEMGNFATYQKEGLNEVLAKVMAKFKE